MKYNVQNGWSKVQLKYPPLWLCSGERKFPKQPWKYGINATLHCFMGDLKCWPTILRAVAKQKNMSETSATWLQIACSCVFRPPNWWLYYIICYILWMEETLHQLVNGIRRCVSYLSNSFQLVQDFATIHSIMLYLHLFIAHMSH